MRNEAPGQPITRSLAVILVAQNDEAGLTATVERLNRALVVTVEDFEILVFDDGSTDNTPTICRELTERFSNLRLIRFEARMGAGHCFKVGISEAKSNFLIYVPADNTWPYRSYIELFGNIGKADIITSYSNNLFAAMSPMRRFASRFYNFMLNSVFRFDVKYYNGLSIFPANFMRSTNFTSSGFGFQAEALLRGLHAGYSFVEIPLPIDRFNVVRSRAVTPRNTLDAITMVGQLWKEFFFLRKSGRARRPALQLVEGNTAVDELGLGGEPARISQSYSDIISRPRNLRIIITGASSGIGEALARKFADDGHHVYICARRDGKLKQIAESRPHVHARPCDVTNEADVRSFVASVAEESSAVDALINCAGAFGEIGPMSATNSDDWWNTIRVNLFGSYLMIKHCLPLLERGQSPRIINMAGGGAFSPFPNYSAYACSKSALVRLTECLAVELQPKNIRVNAVSPGVLATDIHTATLAAGEERAGRLQYRRTLAMMADGGPSIDSLIGCVSAMLSPSFDRLTGKTVSSNFDPWQTKAFLTELDDITSSDLYTLRRVNLSNLNDGYLRKKLAHAWANFGSDT